MGSTKNSRRRFLGLHALSIRSAARKRRIDDLVSQFEARELARLEEFAHFSWVRTY